MGGYRTSVLDYLDILYLEDRILTSLLVRSRNNTQTSGGHVPRATLKSPPLFYRTLVCNMDPEVVQRFLDEQREAAPEELQQDFLDIEDCWDRKLWHQLTDLLVEYFANPLSSSQRLSLFRHFILGFSEKVNQLKFVALGLAAAAQCQGEQSDISKTWPQL